MFQTLRFILGHPLSREHKLGAVKRYLSWQVGSRLLRSPVAIDWVDDSRLLVQTGMTGATGNIYVGLHEFEEMSFALHFLRPGDLFVDVGANVGSYTVLASAACGARSIFIEPVKQTYECLLDNVRLNCLSELTEGFNVAVGSKRSVALFTDSLDTVNHVSTDGESGVEVPMLTLDEIVNHRKPTLIKVDVEGFEQEVINGGDYAFSQADAVIIELNGSGTRYGFSDMDIAASLEEKGLVAFSYRPETRELAIDQRTGPRNVIYVRDLAAARERVSTAPVRKVFGQSI